MKKLYLALVGSVMLFTGCAGVAMHVDDLDHSHKTLQLKSGDSVKIDHLSIENSFEALGSDEAESQALTRLLLTYLEEDLRNKGITIVSNSPQILKISMTRYKKGFRFFPFFGLGNSYFNGKAELKTTSQGTRVVAIEKTGQVFGFAQYSDQTGNNMEYFSTALVNNLVKD